MRGTVCQNPRQRRATVPIVHLETDPRQVYLIGLKSYLTRTWPYFGADVFPQVQVPGALQGLSIALPLYLFRVPEAPFVFLNLLSFLGLCLLAWTRARDLRRSSLLEGSGPTGLRGSRSALSDESPSQGEATAQPAMEADQPRSFANSRGRRASVSSPQTALGLREGPLPGAEKESGPGTDDVCTGQSLPSTTRVAPGRGEVCLVNAKLRPTSAPAHPGATMHSAIRPLLSRFP